MTIKFFQDSDSRHPMASKGRVTYKAYKIGKLPKSFSYEKKDFFNVSGYTFVSEK